MSKTGEGLREGQQGGVCGLRQPLIGRDAGAVGLAARRGITAKLKVQYSAINPNRGELAQCLQPEWTGKKEAVSARGQQNVAALCYITEGSDT